VTSAEVRAFFEKLARDSADAAPQANLTRCQQYAEQILGEAAASKEPKELARGVLDRLKTVEALVRRGANLDAINAGLLLGAKFEAMRLSRIFGDPIGVALEVRRGGGKGGKARHSAEANRVIERWNKLEQRAKTLNAAGWDRRAILDALANGNSGVKRSTIEKNPRIRKHLPRARRNRSP
jgi:hypothetical protein